jgi:outer membrane receptor for ferrienterochelin and colicins
MKENNLELNPVAVTADYTTAKVKNSVYDIKVIDRKVIDQKGANNLRELLMTQLGTSISQDNILGTGVSQQGLSGENVKILIDGVPVIGRLNGNIDLSQINLNNVERVEIIEGPLSALYGSNALGGVVNVITKNKQSNKVDAQLHGYYEQVGQYNVDASVGIKFKNQLLQVNGGRYFFDGFSYPDSSRYKQWKPKEQYFASAAYGVNTKMINFKLKGDYYNELITDRGNLRKPYFVDAFDDYYRTKRLDGSTDFGITFKKSKSFTFKGAYSFYERQKNNYYKDLTNLENTITAAENQDTSIFTNVFAKAVYSFYAADKKLTYQTGIDINYETGRGNRMINRHQSMGDYAFFASFEYKPFSNLILKPAVRIAYNTRFQSPIIPSINIKYKPAQNLTLRASYARGYRAPSLKELYFFFVDINHNILGNENLKSETSHNIQFSLNYIKQVKKVNLDVEGSFFYNNVKNLIRLASTDGNQYTYINVAKSQTLGGAIQFSVWYKQLKTKAGMQLTGIYSDFGNGVTSRRFETTPAISLETNYSWLKPKMEFSLFYKYTGQQPGVYIANSTELKTFYLKGYQLIDISCSKSMYKNLIKLTIGGKNLLNVKNIQSSGTFVANGVHGTATNTMPVGWGASFFADIKINLNSALFKKSKL